MSSYRGAWDGGPPGAEAEYATQHPTAPYAQPPHPAHPAHSTHPTHPPLPPQPPQPPQPPHRAMPTTDPWTGVSYSQYGPPPNYDYHAYGAASSYGYSYDSSYYNQQDGNYYGKYPDSRATHLSQQYSNYNYPPRSHDRSKSPGEPRGYDRRQRSYKSNSRSVSPYENRTRAYSRKRDSSYENENRWRRSRSRSIKSKHTRYSSSDHTSSRSRSSSRSSLRKDKKKNRQSMSSNSSTSERSYKKTRKSRGSDHSLTPPLKKRGSNEGKSKSRSPKIKLEKDTLKEKDVKPHSSKEDKIKDKHQRDVATPPSKKKNETISAQKGNKKTDRFSLTPPRSYSKAERSATPQRHYKFNDHKSESPHRKRKDGSITPPKCYARSRSSSSSRSRSRSSTPRHLKHKRSHTPKSRSRSVSSSSRSSSSSRGSRLKSDRRNKRKSVSKHRSRSRSHSKHHSVDKRSKSRRRSKSKGKNKRSRTPKSKSRSRSHSTRSRSRSGSHSDDERRGQFTVADRKRFWKLHKSRQEKEKEKLDKKSPPKEMKPPPGAVEATHVDDIEYGDPPEVEGPNFAELLPTPEQVMQQSASTSKSKTIPIPIKNDGSFLEMFKKMQEETKKTDGVEVKKPEIKKPALPFIGKRRGGRVLKTGLVKKAKAIDEQTADSTPKDAWSLYMQEVKKYRETSCEEERKTRPLVK